jgi:hypothetical protein
VSGVRHDDGAEFFYRVVGDGIPGTSPVLHLCWRGTPGWGVQRVSHTVNVSSTAPVVLWATQALAVLTEASVEYPPLRGVAHGRSAPLSFRYGDTNEMFMCMGHRPADP